MAIAAMLATLCLLALPARAIATSAAISVSGSVTEVDVLGHADILDDAAGSLDIDDVARSTAFRPGAASTQPPDDAIRWYRFHLMGAAAGRWWVCPA